MKKILVIALTALLVTSCSSYRTLDLNQLTTGMSKTDVINRIGRPQRILAVNDTQSGFQEILEYRTSRDEIYALEFWNDHLTGYEFLYDDINYIPPVAPPLWYPEFGRPIVVYPNRPVYYPNRPNRPSQPSRPLQPSRPSQPNRPNRPNRPSRPETSRPETSRPETNRPGATRPTPGVGPTTRPTTTRPTARPTTRPSTSGGTSTSTPVNDR